MGGPKTETVGGGAATGTADAYNKFLTNGLNTGTFGSPGPNGAATGVVQAGSQTQGFGSAINTMLGGGVGNPGTYSQYFDLMNSGGNGGFSGMGNPPPGYNQTNFQQLGGTNSFGQMFGANGQGGMFGGGGPAMASAGQAGIDFSSFAKPGDAFGANGAGNLLNYNVNSPEFQALKSMQDRQTQLDTANVRARFGAGGGSALSSGASLAENQYLAEANPRNILNLQQMGQNMQQIDMANRGQNAQALLGQRGQNIDMRGQDVNSATQSSIANASNSTQASIANAQGGNQFKIAQMTAALQSMGMDADSAYRAAMANNSNQFGENQAHNTFDQGNYQFGQNLGMQNQSQMNQYALGQGNIGLGMAGLSQQGMQSAMNGLFGAYGQSNQLGTPQSQTVQTPGAFGQFMNGVGGLVNMGTQIYGAINPFGRQGSQPQFGGSGSYPGGFPGATTGTPPMLPPGQAYGNMGFNPQQYMNTPQNYRFGNVPGMMA